MISLVVPVHGDGSNAQRNQSSWTDALRKTGRRFELIVVDDGSPVHWDLLPPARVIRRERNEGYGPAVNAGVAEAQGDWLLVANDDLRLEPDTIDTLLAAATEARSLGHFFAVVPKILSQLAHCGDESGKGGRVRGGLIEIDETPNAVATLYPVGACFLCERRAFVQLGGFDPRFAPYFWEDVDLGWRAWCLGLRTTRVATAIAHHEGSATIASRDAFSKREEIEHRNRVLFALKHASMPEDRAAVFGALLAEVLFETKRSRRHAVKNAFELAPELKQTIAPTFALKEILARVSQSG